MARGDCPANSLRALSGSQRKLSANRRAGIPASGPLLRYRWRRVSRRGSHLSRDGPMWAQTLVAVALHVAAAVRICRGIGLSVNGSKSKTDHVRLPNLAWTRFEAIDVPHLQCTLSAADGYRLPDRFC